MTEVWTDSGLQPVRSGACSAEHNGGSMAHNLDNIDYSHLSAAERLLLVQDILDSVLADAQTEPLTPEQIKELDRRCAAVDAGEMATFPWEDVKHRILSRDDLG